MDKQAPATTTHFTRFFHGRGEFFTRGYEIYGALLLAAAATSINFMGSGSGRDAMQVRPVPSCGVCVCPSVKLLNSVKTNNISSKFFSPSDS